MLKVYLLNFQMRDMFKTCFINLGFIIKLCFFNFVYILIIRRITHNTGECMKKNQKTLYQGIFSKHIICLFDLLIVYFFQAFEIIQTSENFITKCINPIHRVSYCRIINYIRPPLVFHSCK